MLQKSPRRGEKQGYEVIQAKIEEVMRDLEDKRDEIKDLKSRLEMTADVQGAAMTVKERVKIYQAQAKVKENIITSLESQVRYLRSERVLGK